MDTQTKIKLNSQIPLLKQRKVNGFKKVSRSLAEQTEDAKISVLSPLAYLADLLDYAFEHIQKNDQAVTLEDLQGYFHQPFGELPTTPEAVDIELPQIRICVEVLRAYLGQRPLADSAKESALAAAETEYRTTAYRTLLLQLGVSYEEIEQIASADAEDRQKLADRLGIAVAHLNALWQDEQSRSESWLQQVSGLPDTTNVSLTNGGTANFLTWRKERIQELAALFYPDSQEDRDEWIADQNKTAEEAMTKAIQETEEIALPLLREALITPTEQTARWLSDNLLINCEYDACFRISRIGQAIVTMQQLIWSIRTGLLHDTHPELTLEARDFVEEWKWLGTYESWRSAMMVFLYPENVLDPSLRRDSSPQLEDIIDRLRKTRNLSRNDTDAVVNEYEAYFKDICSLGVGATCHAFTEYESDEGVIQARNLFYQFGLSKGKVYYATHDGSNQSYWQKIPSFDDFNVGSIVGAIPYKTRADSGDSDEGERYVYLFVTGRTLKSSTYKVQRDDVPLPIYTPLYQALAFVRFDLRNQEWSEEFNILQRPGGKKPTILLEQYDGEDYAPHLIFNDPGGPAHERTWVYIHHLNAEGTDWEGEAEKLNMLKEVEIKAMVRSGTRSRLFYKDDSGELMLGTIKKDKWGNLSLINKKPVSYPPIQRAEFKGVVSFSTSLLWCFVHNTLNNNDAYYYFRIKLSGANAQIKPALYHPTRIREIVIHNGITKESTSPLILTVGLRMTFLNDSENREYHQAFFTKGQDDKILFYRPFQVIPSGIPRTIIYLKPNEGIQRKQMIESAFNNNPNAGIYVISYLWEAFYFLPIYVASRLQRSHQYVDAKDYFRTIYNYGLPVDERKIFYGLKLEEELDVDYDRNSNWLLDPLNPHAIARTRQNTYTHYTLLTLVRYILQEADAAFTRDTIESLAKARTLYTTALELLNEIELFEETDQASEAEAIGGNAMKVADLLRNRAILIKDQKVTVKASSESVEMEAPNTFSLLMGLLITINSYEFDIPENPVWHGLKFHAEINLFKLNTCRNIAGDERATPPLAITAPSLNILPGFGDNQSIVFPQSVSIRPTPFRYTVLIERAKQLVSLAQQMEASFLSALEKMEAEQLNLLNAKNDLQSAKATIRLQELRVNEANDGVRLTTLQTMRSEIQKDHFAGLLAEGMSNYETAALLFLAASVFVPDSVGFSYGAGFGGSISFSPSGKLQTLSNISSTLASYERQRQEWELQNNLASQDILISRQQERIAQDQVAVVEQEQSIATLRSDQAELVAEFLTHKFTNAELYDWMSDVLEGVYSFFLQQATATAQLAAQQLAFERQEEPPSIILSDYWEPPQDGQSTSNVNGNLPDRRGITGSARLLQDIYQLDQFYFQTDRRKLQLTKTISLASLSPAEFQRFQETGSMTFYTPMEMFDHNFPGHYLRLIKRVRVSVIALVPSTEGIRATLWSNGISRTVLPVNNVFTKLDIRRAPESIAFTSPINATGLFELEANDQSKLYPFESMGVENFWELQMPKASNPSLEYQTIADVIVTIDYTTLNSSTYRKQVIQQLDRTFNADRAYSFKNEFADQWYDLNHPELSATPMEVTFETRRSDFPANLNDVRIKHIVLYFSRKEEYEDEVSDLKLSLNDGQESEAIATMDGIISTRQASGANWLGLFPDKPVAGEWKLKLPPENADLQQAFKDDKILDILFVITYEGMTPDWPV